MMPLEIQQALRERNLWVKTDAGNVWQVRDVRAEKGELFMNLMFQPSNRYENCALFGVTWDSFFVKKSANR